MIFNNWLPWENCCGNLPSYPHSSTNSRQNSKERICMGSLQNTLDNSFTLKRTTVLTIATIQEQAISTKYLWKHIFSVEDDDKCQICCVEKESIYHLISGCDGLSSTQYLKRNDDICKYIHAFLLLEHGFIEKYIPWYQHQPAQVSEKNSTKILWNFPIQTDHEFINNKPDIIVLNKINKTANLIEVAIPNDYNICNKRIQKIRAYTNLSSEIWHSGI